MAILNVAGITCEGIIRPATKAECSIPGDCFAVELVNAAEEYITVICDGAQASANLLAAVRNHGHKLVTIRAATKAERGPAEPVKKTKTNTVKGAKG
jgi:hypothetical protein